MLLLLKIMIGPVVLVRLKWDIKMSRNINTKLTAMILGWQCNSNTRITKWKEVFWLTLTQKLFFINVQAVCYVRTQFRASGGQINIFLNLKGKVPLTYMWCLCIHPLLFVFLKKNPHIHQENMLTIYKDYLCVLVLLC